jgi:YVTN family beta-propeller protein
VSDDVTVIDTATDQVVATVKAGKGPWGVAVGRWAP